MKICQNGHRGTTLYLLASKWEITETLVLQAGYLVELFLQPIFPLGRLFSPCWRRIATLCWNDGHERHRFPQEARVTKASLTKLSTKLTELETDTKNTDALRAAQGLASKLKTFDTELKTHQLAIIDLTDDDDSLAVEQQELDDHNDRASELTILVQRSISTLSPSTAMGLSKIKPDVSRVFKRS